MCSRREATTTGKKPGIRWQISIFPHAALKYESIKRRIIICTLEIQPQKVRREIPYEILTDAPEENPFTCVNSKIDKNETLERFTCIAIFQASGRKKNLVNKKAITAFRRLRWIYVYCLLHEIFENIVFVIWIKNVLHPGYNFSLVVIYICHIELCVIKDLYRTERSHYLYFHM